MLFLKSGLKKIQWQTEEEFYKSGAGMTGYPIVDAGIEGTKRSRFMHNRVEWVVASFLANILIDWQGGNIFCSKNFRLQIGINNGRMAMGGQEAVVMLHLFAFPIPIAKQPFDDLDYIKNGYLDLSFSYPYQS